MKSKRKLLFLLLIILTSASVYSQMPGDVDKNAKVDIVDALLVTQFYVGIHHDIELATGDVNCDKTINITDALLIAQYYVGLIGEFPLCGQFSEIVTVTLQADKSCIDTDGYDEIKLKARGYNKDGEEIPAKDGDFNYLAGTVAIDSNEFTTKKAGEYKLTATINGITSNQVIVTAIDFFNQDNLHEFEIVISRAEWDGMIQDMKDQAETHPLDWTTNYRTGRYRSASVYYKGTAETPLNVKIDNVGIRTKGNTSRVLPQEDDGTYNRFRFKLKFDETFKYDETGEYSLEKNSKAYDERKKRTFLDYEALGFSFPMLGNPSRINVLYVPQLLEQGGVIAGRAVPGKITFVIEGSGATPTVTKYYGIYNIIEPIDKKFLKKHFGPESNDGDLYKCLWQSGGPATFDPLPSDNNKTLEEMSIIGEKDWTQEYRPTYDIKTNESSTDHSDFKAFLDNLNRLNGADLKAYMDETFEVHRFLRFLALNMLIGDPDQYWSNGNNSYFYCNNNGKYQFIPYDFDHGLGTGWLPLKTQAMTDESPEPDWPYRFDIMNWPGLGAGILDGEDQYIEGSIFSMFNLCKASDYWTEADWTAYPVTSKPTENYTMPLANKLLAIPEYQELYVQYLRDFINPETGIFSYATFLKCFNHFKNMYNPDSNTDYLKNDVDIEDASYMQPTTIYESMEAGASNDPFDAIRPSSVEDYFINKIKAVKAALP